MPVTVYGTGNDKFEFPDETPTSVMEKAMSEHYGNSKPTVPAAPVAPRVPYNPATDLQNIYSRRTHEGANRLVQGLKEGGWKGFGNFVMGGLDYANSPISTAAEFVVGRPVDTATNGALPANVVGDVTTMAAPFAPLAVSTAAKVPKLLATALKYGTEAPAAAQAIKNRALALLLEKEGTAADIASRAKIQSQSAETTATRLAKEKSAAEFKAATPSPFTEGRVTTLDERGQPIQTDIVKAKENIYETREKEWNKNSKPVDEKAAEKEASGDYISDAEDAKKILKESKAIVNPSPTKSPTATSLPTPEEASVHKKVIDAFEDRLVEVPESFAKSEKAAGMQIIPKEVTDFATGERSTKYFRKFKTTYEAVTNLNRRFGDAYYGKDVTGFEGVSNSLIKNMYEKISNIKRNYIGKDLYDPLQESYTKYTKMLAPFNETQIGKSISGTQGTTDIANLTPSQVPGAVLSKGAGGFEQVQALGGNPTKALADEVATAFHNPTTNAPKTAAEVRALLHNSDLGSAVNANPEIKAAVNSHIMQLDDAERSAVRATEIGDRLKGILAKKETLSQTATAQRQIVDDLKNEAQSLEGIKSTKETLNAAKDIIKKYAVSPEVNASLTRQLNEAYRLNEKMNTRKFIEKAIAGGALGAVGLGGANAAIHKISGQ